MTTWRVNLVHDFDLKYFYEYNSVTGFNDIVRKIIEAKDEEKC